MKPGSGVFKLRALAVTLPPLPLLLTSGGKSAQNIVPFPTSSFLELQDILCSRRQIQTQSKLESKFAFLEILSTSESCPPGFLLLKPFSLNFFQLQSSSLLQTSRHLHFSQPQLYSLPHGISLPDSHSFCCCAASSLSTTTTSEPFLCNLLSSRQGQPADSLILQSTLSPGSPRDQDAWQRVSWCPDGLCLFDISGCCASQVSPSLSFVSSLPQFSH
ncbi:hypothetical protein GE09DRAFT_636287 [Coniochaeta sp. 2T2.1]|nr:hypothetical protein GE09DRAFT_636287 [Coniochaeta sp. 2T2.1]